MSSESQNDPAHVLKYKITSSKSYKENEKNTDPVGRPVEKSQLKSIIDSSFGCNLDLSLVNNATTTFNGRYMMVCIDYEDCKDYKVEST